MTLPVFYLAPGDYEITGDTLTLRGPEARHALGSMRLQPGESAEFVDGQGLRVTAEITGTSGELTARITDSRTEARIAPIFVLVQALAKGGHDESAVDQCTQLGVVEIVPWQADRCVSVWKDGAKKAKGVAKWQGIARAAVKQCRSAWEPEIGQPLDSKELVEWVQERSAAGYCILLLHELATQPLAEVWDQAVGELALTRGVAVIVGPEGGVSPTETEALVRAGARLARLGENVLRSSLAGAAAICGLSTLSGKWAAEVQREVE